MLEITTTGCSKLPNWTLSIYIGTYVFCAMHCNIWGGADKSLARPGRKQATATKLRIYSTYSPWSSIHFLARCSNFCKPLKKKNSEGCLSNQVSTAAMTSASDEKWGPFKCFFQSSEQVVVWWGQIQRIRWVIKTLEAKFLLGCKCPVHCHARTRPPWWPSCGVFPSECPSLTPAEMSNKLCG